MLKLRDVICCDGSNEKRAIISQFPSFRAALLQDRDSLQLRLGFNYFTLLVRPLHVLWNDVLQAVWYKSCSSHLPFCVSRAILPTIVLLPATISSSSGALSEIHYQTQWNPENRLL